jgi:UDP-N-acetylglucosamine acyltransferase
VGNNVILANAVNMAGHVEIHDWATIGGVVPIHQFVKIGAHCMVGGGFRVPQDICPFVLVGGYPLKVVGINSIGLRRRGFSIERIRTLEQMFKILFFSSLNTSQALERINSEIEKTADVTLVLDFIAKSDRGIIK